jgi:ArsR family transcriptional regulator
MNELSAIFKALSDDTRLRIIKLLENGELCVCDITAALDMVQPKVSFHLNALKEAGLIKDRKAGRWIHYCLDTSDMFKRFLVLAVIEKAPMDGVQKDRKRLSEFLKSKDRKAKVMGLRDKPNCCGDKR